MENEEDWRIYEDWLLKQVGITAKGYRKLFDKLHNTEFVWVLERDACRAKDGRYLRSIFLARYEPDDSMDYNACSVLEMLVALALRTDDEYIGDPGNPEPWHIFYRMLDNLELRRYDDNHYREQSVDNILHRFMYREYGPNGIGGLFPVGNSYYDQRSVEIWSQMLAYINENYHC